MVYDIICTLGPASSTPELWHELVDAGASRFRLNTSHMSPSQVESWLDQLNAAFPTGGTPEVVLDLQGSKWRLGEIETEQLPVGQKVRIRLASNAAGDMASPAGGQTVLPMPHEDFFAAAARSAGVVRLNDARVELTIEKDYEGELHCRVSRGGPVGSRKGVTLQG